MQKILFVSLMLIGGLFLSRQASASVSPEPVTYNLTRGERNNNPGNIRYDSRWVWQGQIGKDDAGYLIFDSVANGVRAIGKDLLTKFSRGLNTVRSIVSVYAPPFENNTAAYISAVSNYLGISADTEINLFNPGTLRAMVSAMIRQEIGSSGLTRLAKSDIDKGIALALS